MLNWYIMKFICFLLYIIYLKIIEVIKSVYCWNSSAEETGRPWNGILPICCFDRIAEFFETSYLIDKLLSMANDLGKKFWHKVKPEIHAILWNNRQWEKWKHVQETNSNTLRLTLTSSTGDQYLQWLQMLPGKPPSWVVASSGRAVIPHGNIESPEPVLPMQKGS